MKFSITRPDGTKETKEIPDRLPYVVGRECRDLIDIELEQTGGKMKKKWKNPAKTLTKLQDVLVNKILEDDNIDQDTADRLLDKYYEEIGNKKKSRKANSSTKSKQKQK